MARITWRWIVPISLGGLLNGLRGGRLLGIEERLPLLLGWVQLARTCQRFDTSVHLSGFEADFREDTPCLRVIRLYRHRLHGLCGSSFIVALTGQRQSQIGPCQQVGSVQAERLPGGPSASA